MKVLRAPKVTEKVGLTVQHIGRLERAGRFPQRIQLGPGSVGWIEEEVDAWLEQRARQRGALPQPEKATEALRAKRNAGRGLAPKAATRGGASQPPTAVT